MRAPTCATTSSVRYGFSTKTSAPTLKPWRRESLSGSLARKTNGVVERGGASSLTILATQSPSMSGSKRSQMMQSGTHSWALAKPSRAVVATSTW